MKGNHYKIQARVATTTKNLISGFKASTNRDKKVIPSLEFVIRQLNMLLLVLTSSQITLFVKKKLIVLQHRGNKDLRLQLTLVV